MKSKVSNGTTFEQRTLKRILEIKVLVKADPKVCFNNKVYRKYCELVVVLVKLNILLKIGTAYTDNWKWNDSVVINNKLVNKIANNIRDTRRKYYLKSKSSQAPIDVNLDLNMDTTDVGDVRYVSDFTKHSEFILSTYSDQELWNELKKRNYIIKEDKLFKLMYLE